MDIVNNRSCIKAIDSVGVPPLPIPNREVKPNSADGTANVCGRVGHRHFFWEESFKQLRLSFFVCGNSSIPAIIINSFYFTAAFNLSLLGSPAKSGGLSKKFSQSIEEKL